jgi:hypothetical protein
MRLLWLTAIVLSAGAAALAGAACSDAAGTGGFAAFGYGDGGAYQGTTAVVTIAVSSSSESSSAVSTSSVVSSSSGMTCPDDGPGEPNDTIDQATVLGTISDNDADGVSIQAALATVNDVDWYRYHGVDLFGNVVDPTRQLLSTGLRICKYIECDGGESNSFSCPSGTMADTQAGHPGCCWSATSPVTIDLTCGSSSLDSDNATVFIRVDDPTKVPCQAYTLSYHY